VCLCVCVWGGGGGGGGLEGKVAGHTCVGDSRIRRVEAVAQEEDRHEARIRERSVLGR
jgi:nicotinamide mononucleotide (NMN) deamidase PncC